VKFCETLPNEGVAVMVEICAGSAVLSAEAQKRGFQIFPIDHAHNRFRAAAAILVIDLAHPDSRQLLPILFNTVRPAWCHMGLPCGTCSRARERPVSQALREAGAPNPRPLRGPDHLFGFPHLTDAEAQRVDAANQVYMTAEVLFYHCFLLDIFLSVENPERSWLWALLAALVKQRSDLAYQNWYFALSDITFDACMHGGAFPKATKLHHEFLIFWVLDVTIHTPMRVGGCGRNMVHGSLILLMKLFIPTPGATYGRMCGATFATPIFGKYMETISLALTPTSWSATSTAASTHP